MPRRRVRGAAQTGPVRGKYSPERVAWLDLGAQEVVLHIYPDELVQDLVPEHILYFKTTGAKSWFTLDMTAMTVAELEALRDFVTKTINDAIPLVRELEADAKEKFENGDDAFPRLYRRVPQVIDRRRQEPADGQGLPE